MSDYFWTVFNFLASIIAALLSGKLNLNSYESFLVGLILFIALSLLQQLYSLASLNKRLDRLLIAEEFKGLKINSDIYYLIKDLSNASIEALDNKKYNKVQIRNDTDGLSALFCNQVFEELSKCLSKIQDLADGNLVFNKELGRLNWRKVMTALKHTYKTTNILSNKDTFGRNGKGTTFYNLQEKAIKDRKCDIERIFIYKDWDELKESQELIRDQIEAGIKVRIISMDEYDNEENMILSERLGCSDFAIIDDNYVYTTSADTSLRKTTYIRITSNKEKLRTARELYSSVSSSSKSLNTSELNSLINTQSGNN
ncbi:MAG: hypothetical protein AAFV71_11205 [Cyanobacteria bacterium J06633_8]